MADDLHNEQRPSDAAQSPAEAGDPSEAVKTGSDAQSDLGGPEVRTHGNFAIQLTETRPEDITFDIIGNATDEEVQLRSDIESTITTLRGIFPRADSDPRQEAAFNRYIEKLFWIATAGLQAPGQPRLASVALQSFQNDVLWREGGHIKNNYMKTLGYWATIFAGAATILYICLFVARAWTPLGNSFSNYDTFLVLWIGAMIGCWLSFGIRNVQLTFSNLGRPESDLLEPNVRLVFTGLLAITLGLIFKVGMVQVEMGGLKTLELSKPSVALIIGLFCGIAEQALSSTIGNRASQFLGQISK